MQDIIAYLQKIEKKIDVQSKELQEIRLVQVRHEDNLKEHMKRTEAAESRLLAVESFVIPIKNHIVITNMLLKFAAVVSAAIYAIKKLL